MSQEEVTVSSPLEKEILLYEGGNLKMKKSREVTLSITWEKAILLKVNVLTLKGANLKS